MEIAVSDLARAEVAARIGEIISELRNFADELETFHLPEPPK